MIFSIVQLTVPVALFNSVERKLPDSSKCISVNLPFLINLLDRRPLTSCICNNIWLLFLPGNNILPVYSSYRVQPMDHVSKEQSYGKPRTIDNTVIVSSRRKSGRVCSLISGAR